MRCMAQTMSCNLFCLPMTLFHHQHVKGKDILGGWSLMPHQSFWPCPFPHQRKISTEGILGQYLWSTCMLGRTLCPDYPPPHTTMLLSLSTHYEDTLPSCLLYMNSQMQQCVMTHNISSYLQVEDESGVKGTCTYSTCIMWDISVLDLSVLPSQNWRRRGKAYFVGASVHIKGFGSIPIPLQRQISTEGIGALIPEVCWEEHCVCSVCVCMCVCVFVKCVCVFVKCVKCVCVCVCVWVCQAKEYSLIKSTCVGIHLT